MKKNGFSTVELLIAGGIFAFFVISVIGASLVGNNICNASIIAHDLQRDAAAIVRQMAARDTGENDFVGLRSATERINDINNPTDLVFMGADGNERRYRAAGNSIFYISPTVPGGNRTIYTAAAGVTIQFNYAVLTARRIMLDLVLSQPFSGRTISGSARLVVPLKNV